MAEKIYSDKVDEVRLVVQSDDICHGCKMLKEGLCIDVITHREDFTGKEAFNNYLDRRILDVMKFMENQIVSTKDIIERADLYLDNIYSIYEGNDPGHTEARKSHVEKGLKKKNCN